MTTAPEDIKLTEDQQKAMEAFQSFLLDPTETAFVLSGYSGCGKSTLVRTLLDQLPGFMKMMKLINPSQRELFVELTATTNKAAETLSRITGWEVRTIHSALGLRVETDYAAKTSRLVPRSAIALDDTLLFIDEASYIDAQLLGYIFSLTRNCKIVFVGDPAQLTPVKATGTPVFDAKFTGAELTQVVRQAEGNPIIDLSTKFRNTVKSGEFFSFKPDGHHVVHMKREDFDKKVIEEFTRPDWRYLDSKVLAWTNKRVIDYNNAIRSHAKGSPDFQVGDYAICNSFVSLGRGNGTFKTDELVHITSISHDVERHGVMGNIFTLNYGYEVFMPKSLAEKNARIKQARAVDDMDTVVNIESSWIDLRAAYAQTINKAQGSTYDKVFIDLDDISRCNSGDQIARMMYVAVSRARNFVYLTGDLA